MNTISPFLLMMIAVLMVVLLTNYFRFRSAQRFFQTFLSHHPDVKSENSFSFLPQKYPKILGKNYQVEWLSEGKGRSKNLILQIQYQLQTSMQDFVILNEYAFQSRKRDDLRKVADLLYTNLPPQVLCFEREEMLREIIEEYGFGVMECKNQEILYRYPAQISTGEAWSHIEMLVQFMDDLNISH